MIPPGHFFRKIRYSTEIYGWDESEEEFMEPDDPRPPKLPLIPHLTEPPHPHPANKYLFDKQHDARIKGIRVKRDRITLRMHDHELWRLSTCLKDRIEPKGKLFFPLEMEFIGVRAWTAWYKSNDDWRLHRLRNTLKRNVEGANEFIFDRLMVWDPNRVVFFLWFESKPGRNHRSFSYPWSKSRKTWRWRNSIILAMDASEIIVLEMQREAWLAAFGADHEFIFNEFQKTRENHRWHGLGEFDVFLDSLGVQPPLVEKFAHRFSRY